MNGEEEYDCPDQCLHQLWRHHNLYVLHSVGCRSLLIGVHFNETKLAKCATLKFTNFNNNNILVTKLCLCPDVEVNL